jgi:class 3 adenylate cyclase
MMARRPPNHRSSQFREHEGTLERFTGDGMMIFFNDPVLVPDPAERAIRMALAMRERVHHLVRVWQKRGYDLALGVGIAQGYATIGAIGFEGRWDYLAGLVLRGAIPERQAPERRIPAR